MKSDSNATDQLYESLLNNHLPLREKMPAATQNNMISVTMQIVSERVRTTATVDQPQTNTTPTQQTPQRIYEMTSPLMLLFEIADRKRKPLQQQVETIR